VQRSAMRRCLKGLGGRPTSTDGFILGPVTRHSGSASLSLRYCPCLLLLNLTWNKISGLRIYIN